ncbi:MAG: hypothetical protein FWF97_04715 [Alphaproteobacteria bacterium]|nr:hypothetical protein [Alphaproteobacteria bacterium]
MWNIEEMKKELKTLMGIKDEKEFLEFLAKERRLPIAERFSLFPSVTDPTTLRKLELLQKIFLLEQNDISLDVLNANFNWYMHHIRESGKRYDRDTDTWSAPDWDINEKTRNAGQHNLRVSGVEGIFKNILGMSIAIDGYKHERNGAGPKPGDKHYGAFLNYSKSIDAYIYGLKVLLAEQKLGIDNSYPLEQYIKDRNEAKLLAMIETEKKSDVILMAEVAKKKRGSK